MHSQKLKIESLPIELQNIYDKLHWSKVLECRSILTGIEGCTVYSFRLRTNTYLWHELIVIYHIGRYCLVTTSIFSNSCGNGGL